MGGGGVLGVFQWVYIAPTQKAINQANAKATNLDIELKANKEIIDSLQRTLKRLEKDSEADKELVKALKNQLEETEKTLLYAL